MKRVAGLGLLSFALAIPFAAGAPTTAPSSSDHPGPKALATLDELKAMLDSGDAKGAYSEVKRVLARGDVVAAGYDRHKVLVFKAECEIQLKDKPGALATWNTIQHEADKSAAINDKAEALAMQAMLKKSNGFFYAPKTATDKTPIDIVKPEERTKAFQALFDDDFSIFKQKFVNSKAQTSLKPLRQVAADFGCVQAEEKIAAGRTSQTDAFSDTIVTWASHLIDNTINNWDSDLDRLRTRANEMVEAQVITKRGQVVKRRQRRGLTGDDRTRVQTIHDQADDVPGTIDAMNLSFVHPIQLKGSNQSFSQRALVIRDRAEKMLDRSNATDGD